MGRPKALRNRDVVKSVDIKKVWSLDLLWYCLTCAQTGKKINFDETEDEAVGTHVEEVVERVSNVVSVVDAVPEEVKNDTEEILSLKRLHEQMIDPAKRRPKRKAVKNIAEVDAELDVSILNSLDDVTAVEDDNNVPSSSSVLVTGPGKIDKSKKNSKKLWVNVFLPLVYLFTLCSGNIVVSVLPDEYVDPIASFKVQKSVQEFTAANNRHERINYSTFSAQKKGKLVKSFFVK